jgi:hypothetical protein
VREQPHRAHGRGRGSSLAAPWWRVIDGVMVGNGLSVGTRHSFIDAHSTLHDANRFMGREKSHSVGDNTGDGRGAGGGGHGHGTATSGWGRGVATGRGTVDA